VSLNSGNRHQVAGLPTLIDHPADRVGQIYPRNRGDQSGGELPIAIETVGAVGVALENYLYISFLDVQVVNGAGLFTGEGAVHCTISSTGRTGRAQGVHQFFDGGVEGGGGGGHRVFLPWYSQILGTAAPLPWVQT
jgi:hypothetical protein